MDRGDVPVVNQWRKAGDQWYWMDGNGLTAASQIVEDKDNYYYVGDNGVMVTNQWVRVENTEVGEDAPAHWWYYFGEDGRAYKAKQSGKTSFRTINGGKYAFGEDGKMLFGWVDEYSTRQTGEDAWKDGLYYMGGEDDGALTLGWKQIHVIDDDTERWDDKGIESEDQDYWFYFQPNGKKLCANDSGALKHKTINGNKYSFDETGRMAFEWTRIPGGPLEATASTPGNGASVDQYYYFQDRDNGARMSKGWFKVVPDTGVNYGDSDDEEARWFYAYKEGRLYASEFKTIDGKRYCFDNGGGMLAGLQAVYTDGLGRIWNRELETQELMEDATALLSGGDTYLKLIGEDGSELQEELTVRDALAYVAAGEDPYGEDGRKKKPSYGVYYFGGEDDRAARTSGCSVKVDGESYKFLFKGDGGKKGCGWNGKKGKYLYQEGRRVLADKDEKYEAYFTAAEPWQKENGKLVGVDSPVYQDAYKMFCADEDVYFLPGHLYRAEPDNIYLLYNWAIKKYAGASDIEIMHNRIYLVNTSGTVLDGTRTARTPNDCVYQVYNGCVVLYAWPRMDS